MTVERTCIGLVAMLMLITTASEPSALGRLKPVVEIEEDVYTYEPPNNGAGPTWCFGSTCILRTGGEVFISGLQTIPEAKPLNNCLTTLFQRGPNGWKMAYKDAGRTREPSPLGCFQDGHILLSTNPTLTPPDTYAGPSEPAVLAFLLPNIGKPKKKLQPVWEGKPVFGEHSYRSFAVDGVNRQLFLSCNIGYDKAYWSFRDKSGKWTSGALHWPRTTASPDSEPLRLCYGSSAVRNGAVHYLAVSDEEEPNHEWHKHKIEKSGAAWDYVFRRIYYSMTPDIGKRPFAPWLEVASVEDKGGNMFHCDLYVDDRGDAHVLWIERTPDAALRDKYFPGEPLTVSLKYAVVRRGRFMSPETLVKWTEGSSDPVPDWGRFHVTSDGRLLVIYTVCNPNGGTATRLREIGPKKPQDVEIPLKDSAQGWFFTATPRAGSLPSDTIDLLWACPSRSRMRYARVKVGWAEADAGEG